MLLLRTVICILKKEKSQKSNINLIKVRIYKKDTFTPHPRKRNLFCILSTCAIAENKILYSVNTVLQNLLQNLLITNFSIIIITFVQISYKFKISSKFGNNNIIIIVPK